MQTRVNSYSFQIHQTPMEYFEFDENGDFIVEFDDISNKRVRARFPGGGLSLKITLEDCFDFSMLEVNGKFPRQILVVENSPWAEELITKYISRNPYDKLIERIEHIIIPLGDNIVEVATWSYTVEYVK